MLRLEEVARLASMSIWQQLDELVAGGRVVVDRPRGCPHPKIAEYVYPLDYGYIEGTDGGDGEGIDVWLGGGGHRAVTAVFCTFDPTKRNAEVKVALGCRPEDIRAVEAFYAPQPQAVITVWRPEPAR
jgi:inorganic pyrophosphatase